MQSIDVARQVLVDYGISVDRIEPLKNNYNTTFRVFAKSSDEYVLRICHPRRSSINDVRSELLWLAALRRMDDLHVPDPVKNKKSQYVTAIGDFDGAQPRLCALFRWTSGRFLSRTLAPEHLFRVGTLMARLHDHATHWKQPAGFTRPRVENLNPLHPDQDDPFDDTAATQAMLAIASVSSPEDAKAVGVVIRRVWKILQKLGQGPEHFGLIHADIHQWNYLFHKGRVGVIDFDDCGYGHWLYDVAVTLYCLEEHPRFAALKEGLLAGYRQNRPFTAAQEKHLEAFMALRRLQDLLWVIEERNRPAFQNSWQTTVANGLAKLREFVNC